MIDDLIDQLRDDDPNVRRQAIIALGKSKSIQALRPLANVFRGDSDPELRELARKAGVYIRQNNPGVNTPAPTPREPLAPTDSQMRRRSLAELAATVDEHHPDEPPARPKRSRRDQEREQRSATHDPYAPPEDEDDDPIVYRSSRGSGGGAAAGTAAGIGGAGILGDEEDERGIPQRTLADYGFVRGKDYRVDREDRERARKNLDAALTMQMKGDIPKALKTLALALKLDPNLINDGFFNSVASSVTGRDGDEAILVLISGERRSEQMSAAKKEQRKRKLDEHLERVSEGSSAGLTFELIIFTLVNGAFPVIITLIIIQGLINFTGQLIESVGTSPDLAAASAFLSDGELLATSLNNQLLLTLAIVGASVAIGSLVGLLVQSVVTHFVALLLGGRGRLIYQLTAVTGALNKYLPFYYILLCVIVGLVFVVFPWPLLCAVLILPLFALFINFKVSEKIGESYAFGKGLGCLAFGLSAVVIYLIFAAIGFVANSAVDQALQNLIFSST